MAEIIVVRFENYPVDEPRGWAVGFNVVCNNGRSFYIDTIVDFNKAQTDEDAVNIALEELRETIQKMVNELEKKLPLIGTKLTL
jgi:hypothetical protein